MVMNKAPLPDHLLYASEDDRTFLIDIPRSIANAQGFVEEIQALKSCQPVAVPYQSTEPKSERARSKVSNHGDHDNVHSVYQSLCTDSLSQIRDAVDKSYCLPRCVIDDDDDASEPTSTSDAFINDPTRVLQSLVNSSSLDESWPGPSIFSVMRQDTEPSPWIMTGNMPYVQDIADWGRALGATPSTDSTSIEIKAMNHRYKNRLRIPPRSCFVLGPCNLYHGGQLFRRVAQHYTPTSTFDMVYMDPPWPNRSAKRKGPGGYRIEQTMQAVKRMLLDMNLWVYLKQGGHLAVWITNRAACRDVVMDLFDQWDLSLVEEWVYLKIAADGRAVTPIDGTWRKPYEVLLIAQSGQVVAEGELPIRRVIAAVPDLHSRKPGLQSLFNSLLLRREPGCSATVLEIFARNLTAGWMAWGDETLKYNWDHNWA